MKKKILLVGPVPPPVGGVSIHVARLTNRIISSADLDCALLDIGRLKFYDHKLQRKNIVESLSFFISCDIVHLHISHKWKFLIARISKMFGKKVIYTRHNARMAGSENDIKFHSLVDAAIFVSLKNTGVLDEKSYLIPAFISAPPGHFLPEKVLQELVKYKKVICAISSHPENKPALIDEKDIYGFDLLLQAFENSASDSDILLLLLDPFGTMKAAYEKKVSQLKLKGKQILYLTETIDFSELLKYLTIYVRPTRSDGDSIAIREALETGVKVLASDCCLRPEGVELFASNNISSLEANLDRVLNMPDHLPKKQPEFSEMIIDIYRKL